MYGRCAAVFNSAHLTILQHITDGHATFLHSAIAQPLVIDEVQFRRSDSDDEKMTAGVATYGHGRFARADDHHDGDIFKVAECSAFFNARKNSDMENARIEHDKALKRVMISTMKNDTVLYKQFADRVLQSNVAAAARLLLCHNS